MTTRGLGPDELREAARVVAEALSDRFDDERDALSDRTKALMQRYPLYPQLSAATI